MEDPADASLSSLARLLSVASTVYGGAVRLRQALYESGRMRAGRLPCAVISIGNLTVGGTGKTPMTLWVAERVRRMGYRTAVVSRGYKGRAEKRGGIVSDGRTVFMGPEAAGDEPYMMSRRLNGIPVVVGRNRFEAGMLAIKSFDTQVLVLDDAFQHLKLARDLDLVLLDCRRPFGNMKLLPRGRLREPLSALLRGHAFVLTRADAASDMEADASLARLRRYARSKPVFKAAHVPAIKAVVPARRSGPASAPAPGVLRGRRIFAFSGLARNSDFLRTIAGFDCTTAGSLRFADHHAYSGADFEKIAGAAAAAGAECLVTSEKDYARILGRAAWPLDLFVIGIDVDFGPDERAFDVFLKSRLELLMNP